MIGHARKAARRVRNVHPFHHLFLWFSHGNRLVALVVVTATIAVSALAYTFANDRSQSAAEKRAASDRAAFFACVPRYVSDLSRTNLPRTIASIEASNARFNWDVGHDKDHPTWDKAQLKAEYVKLYRKYQRVVVTNPPLPAFSAKYCESGSKPTPLSTPSAAPSTKSPKPHSHKKAPAAIETTTSSPASQTGSAGGGSSKGSHGAEGHSKPPAPSPTPAPGSPGGPVPPSVEGVVCSVLPALCGDLRLPIPFA